MKGEPPAGSLWLGWNNDLIFVIGFSHAVECPDSDDFLYYLVLDQHSVLRELGEVWFLSSLTLSQRLL